MSFLSAREAHQRALEFLSGADLLTKRALLQSAGVLDVSGDLAARYEPSIETVVQQDRLSNALPELFLHFDCFRSPSDPRWTVTLGLGEDMRRVGEGSTPEAAVTNALSSPDVQRLALPRTSG